MCRTRKLTSLLVCLALAVFALAPAQALADGDPASDVLLGENVFYPYTPPVTAALQKTLNAQTAAAKKAGFPIKVALIASPVDLGVIPDLFGKPQKYADFLDQEISYQTKQPLLVVMSTGYGVVGVGPKATAAAATLPKPAGKTSSDLAQAAITAVDKLAKAAGHPLSGAGSTAAHKSSSGSSTLLIVLVVAVALVGAALGFIAVRRRAATAR